MFEKVVSWIAETLRRGGAEIEMGLKFCKSFTAAGLPIPQMLTLTLAEGGADSEAYEMIEQTVRTLLPKMEAFGVATNQDVEIETLATRLRNEAVSAGALIILPSLVGAWSRKP
ncbi:hypothetical protein L0244_40435 [bacterium]|nr:hypothetical protein [bacterium]